MFRRLSSYYEAQKTIQRLVNLRPLGVEKTPLSEVSNRVLGENITASLNIPPFAKSTVDGYAVRAEDTHGAEENRPATLKVCGIVNIGESSRIMISKGRAAEISTGAPMPKGANASVMVEHTEREDNYVHVLRAVAKDQNVMKVGADIRKDETILKTGQLLTSREVGVLAALGICNIGVYAVPRVAVLSTGGEVIEPGRELCSGKIYDINTYSLSAAVLENGGSPLCLGVVPDELKEIQRALRYGLASADMMLTSGGVSVGPKDIMPKALNSMGKPGVIICGIAIKPGKPTTVALIGRKVVFSLPGHPTSALLGFHLLARPVLQAISGRKTSKSLEVKALMTTRISSAKGRRTFVMVRLKRDKLRRLTAEPVLAGLSGAITTLGRADGFVEISEKVQFIDAGETVSVHLFRGLEKV